MKFNSGNSNATLVSIPEQPSEETSALLRLLLLLRHHEGWRTVHLLIGHLAHGGLDDGVLIDVINHPVLVHNPLLSRRGLANNRDRLRLITLIHIGSGRVLELGRGGLVRELLPPCRRNV